VASEFQCGRTSFEDDLLGGAKMVQRGQGDMSDERKFCILTKEIDVKKLST
jgi:hypothetical protein